LADFEVTLRVNLDAGNLAGQLSGQLGQIKGQYSQFDSEINKVQKSLDGAGDANQKFASNLSTTRYALYDVASSLTAISVGLLAFSVGSAAVALSWERHFANVARTTGLVGTELDAMQGKFVALAQTMPVAFEELTKIGTLGAQLGILDKDLIGFTETVVMFSAATGISAEQSAQAFGRLGNILGVAASEYSNLGSSIVAAGVSAVATESEIVAVAQQIGPMARLVGISADEVIGFSTALASVKVPPELARSVITKTFSDISRAVAEGGEKLDMFGKALGISGDAFAQAWSDDAMGTFVGFLDAIPTSGAGAIEFLDQFGITSRRDVPTLQKLAQNIGLVRDSLQIAGTGFNDNTELMRQYGIIAETTAAKLQVLGNNFQALLAAVGGAATGPISSAVDSFSALLAVFTQLASTDAGQWVSGLAIGITALVGALAAVGAAVAVGFAGIIAMQQALVGLTGSTGVASIGVSGLTAQLIALGGAGRVAAVGVQAASVAVKALAVAMAALITFAATTAIAKWVGDIKYELQGLNPAADAAFDRLIDGADKVQKAFGETGFTQTLTRAFAPVNADTLVRDVATVDETFAKMVAAGHIDTVREQMDTLRSRFKDAGIDTSAFNIMFTDTIAAMKEASTLEGSDPFGGMGDGLGEMAGEAEAAIAALEELRAVIDGYNNSQISAESAAIAQAQALNDMATAAEDAAASLTGTDEASLALRSAMVEVDRTSREAAAAILENGGSVERATEAYNAGRSAIIAMGIARGMDASAAAAWADEVLGSAATAQQAIADYAAELAAVPPEKDTAVTNNAPAAGESLRAYIERVEGIPGDKNTNLINNAPVAAEHVGQYNGLLGEVPPSRDTSLNNNAPSSTGLIQGYIDTINNTPPSRETSLNNNAPSSQGLIQGYINTINNTPPSRDTSLNNNASGASGAVNGYIGRLNSIPRSITTVITTQYVTAGAVPGSMPQQTRAYGGPIYGPGTKTSDSVPILASRGEYMIRAAAVDKYGIGFMNALNAGKIQKFASGGPVSSPTASPAMGGVVELGPKSLAAVARQVAVNVMLDEESISRAAQRGDQKRRLSGDFHA
jgi:TP901 family phage tail tape measure protein